MEQKQPNGMPEDIYPERNIQMINESITNSDQQTVADRLNKYQQLDSEERLKIAKNIAILIEKMGEKGPTYLKSLLNKMVKDRENIYKTLLNQIPELDKMLSHLNTYQNVIKDILIPILVEFLNFNQLEIKQQAGKQLALLTHKLDNTDRGDFVLKHVIQMAHDDGNEDNRIVAVQLFSSMSQIFGSQLCEQYIGLQMLSLGEDTSFKVRKQAIKQLPIISKLVSKQFFVSRLYPFFLVKSKEQSNWALRKACVEVIIDIAQMAQSQQRQTSLTQTMLSLLKDSNKWVRVSAYKSLGRFIYTLKGKKIHQKLISQYGKMIDSDVNSIGKDNQIIYSCAYNFPAVLDALGAAKWQKQLWKIYEKLLKHTDKRIKKTLSQSLHEVAKILGQKLTEQYLFGVVDMFFKQKSDDIKLGMIRNMAGILSVLSQAKRQQFVGVFQQFQKDQKKWRIRECIAIQLGQILKLYDAQTTFVYIVPTLFKFCSDSVSIVREQAASKVGDFITKFQKQQIYLPGLIENIKAFGVSPKYTQRQSFLIMCQKLMDHKDLFLKHLMPIMESLTKDKVLNVRLILAQTVKKHVQSKGALSEQEVMLKLIETIKADQNEEIKDVFKEQ